MKNKGAVLIVMWSFLVTNVYYLLRDAVVNKSKDKNRSLDQKMESHYDPLNVSVNGIVMLSMTFLFPIGGWLADARLGRYKTVCYSIWIMWIGTILATLVQVLPYVSSNFDVHITTWIFCVFCVVMMTGLSGFQSNIVQLGIDQLTDASSDEIRSFILWYILTLYACGLSLDLVSECVVFVHNMFYIKTLTVAVCLTVALCSTFLCKHWLVEEEVRQKSLNEIWKVIRYILTNRKVRYDFGTGESGDSQIPSQFDIAKHQYGGHFTALQVENVRTFLWMTAILGSCGIVFGAIMPVEYAREKVQHRWEGQHAANGLTGCYKKIMLHYEDYIFVLILIVSFEFVIHPVICKFLPKWRIVSKFVGGTIFLLLWILSLLAIEAVAYNKGLSLSNRSATELYKCIFQNNEPEIKFDQKWFIIPDVIGGIACLLLVMTALEYIWAQTPSTMKGLMFGIAYALLGLNTLLQSIISVPFLFINIGTTDWHPLTCGIWYFTMEAAIMLVVLIIIMVLIRKYKKRRQTYAVFDRQTPTYSQLN